MNKRINNKTLIEIGISPRKSYVDTKFKIAIRVS